MSTDTDYFDQMQEEILFPSLAEDFDDFVYVDEDGDMDDPFSEYCDYCEREGHTFRTCARRDDAPDSHIDMLDNDDWDV